MSTTGELKFRLGDRVVYTGPAINDAWDAAKQGEVIGVTKGGRIHIRWLGGGINLSHDPEHFETPENALILTRKDTK